MRIRHQSVSDQYQKVFLMYLSSLLDKSDVCAAMIIFCVNFHWQWKALDRVTLLSLVSGECKYLLTDVTFKIKILLPLCRILIFFSCFNITEFCFDRLWSVKCLSNFRLFLQPSIILFIIWIHACKTSHKIFDTNKSEWIRLNDRRKIELMFCTEQ